MSDELADKVVEVVMPLPPPNAQTHTPVRFINIREVPYIRQGLLAADLEIQIPHLLDDWSEMNGL